MEWKIFFTAFATLFFAEIGDKTQLAVITMTSKTNAAVSVFLGASLALIMATLLGVAFGSVIDQLVPMVWIQRAAALIFISIGVLMFFGKL